MRVTQKSKGHFNAKPWACNYLETKISEDFQISISVPLTPFPELFSKQLHQVKSLRASLKVFGKLRHT